MLNRVLLFISFFVFSSHLSGQSHTNIGDHTSRPESMMEMFNRAFPDHHTKKIMGRAYTNPYMSAPEHQFFKSKTSMQGILYTPDDTIQCEDLFYDLHRGKILVYVEELYKLIEVDNAFIERFILYEPASRDTFEFININESGFHQKIFEGDNFAMYKKHSKFYKQKANQGRYFHGFDKYEQLVFRNDNTYFMVRKNQDLLAQFPENEKSLKKYLRKSHVKLRRVSDHQARAIMKHLEEMYPMNTNPIFE